MSSIWNIDKQDLLKPENMIYLYARGAFPMAGEDGTIEWYMPEVRTIIPLDNYNYPKSLKKFINSCGFSFHLDKDPIRIIKKCAERENTWISDELIDAYKNLHKQGHIHSVEVYDKNSLIGGLYGVTYRGAFFGESMFSKKSQASKAALIKLLEHLNNKNFVLLDVQFLTEHLKMFGAVEIEFEEYEVLLKKSYSKFAKF